jgi:hypothetical protein
MTVGLDSKRHFSRLIGTFVPLGFQVGVRWLVVW